MRGNKIMENKTQKIEWGTPEPSEDDFKAFIKSKKITGLPKGYHTPEIFEGD